MNYIESTSKTEIMNRSKPTKINDCKKKKETLIFAVIDLVYSTIGKSKLSQN